ncbi:hypothetical protein DL765_000566 [Monosporascus sp. GIB2]|nr:hypothetical protein DL765_000566 [Monosporascus sp. GIB2]
MASGVGEAAAAADEIKPYKIHVSSRYLDLTKQKLEITRLPHEFSEPRSDFWWEPKSQIEPLIDFWLEQYSWRAQEDVLNSELPQFRTAFTVPSSETPLRTHFVHVRSPHSTAIPLLLIPPFPTSNLSLGHLVRHFTEPQDAATQQPFHLVIPALPGVGFSDALPNNVPVISTTARFLDSLMRRLSYRYYLVTNASSGSASPAEIDYRLARHLAVQYSDSCLGTHLISPPLAEPKLGEAPLEWAKWSCASLLRSPVLGYRSEDFSAIRRCGSFRPSRKTPPTARHGANVLGLREPNTLAYALCDSPTGLLAYVLKILRLFSPDHGLTPAEIVNFTHLAWLPGPEAAMRFWAYCARNSEKAEKKSASKPRVSLTVFLGDSGGPEDDDNAGARGGARGEGAHPYSCPSWARAKYDVVSTQRAAGKPGLLAWERPEIIAAGARSLAAAVSKADARLRPAAPPVTAPLEQVVTGVEENVASPPTSAPASVVPKPDPARLAPPAQGDRMQPIREVSDETAVGSHHSIPSKDPSPVPAEPQPQLHTATPVDARA